MAIILPSGFNITNNEPVDARFSLADQTARYGLSSANIYEGLVVYQRDNNTLWILIDTAEVSNSNGWQQVTSSDVSEGIAERINNLEATSASHDDRLDQLQADSGSQSGRLDNLELETGSIETEQNIQNDRLSQLEVVTSSLDATYEEKASGTHTLVSGSSQIVYGDISSLPTNIVSQSTDSNNVAFTITNGVITADLKGGVISGSDQLTSSLDDHYVTLDTDQTISGEKTFNNIVVNGTGSFAYIESIGGSAKIIGDAFVVVNTATPTSRYAGLQVYDSGSTLSTASFYFDGETNDWGYEYSSSTGVDYAVTIFGPEYSTKGSPTYLTDNRIPKAVDNHHLNDSNISDNGTIITLGSNTTVTGTLSATGDVVAYASSDRRLKDNVLPIENPLQKINQIGGYSFDWNEEKQNIYIGKDYGVIAQEIEEILPELVNTREDGYKAVKYDKLVSLLIEGIKELSKEVAELKQKIKD